MHKFCSVSVFCWHEFLPSILPQFGLWFSWKSLGYSMKAMSPNCSSKLVNSWTWHLCFCRVNSNSINGCLLSIVLQNSRCAFYNSHHHWQHCHHHLPSLWNLSLHAYRFGVKALSSPCLYLMKLKISKMGMASSTVTLMPTNIVLFSRICVF